MLISYTQKWQKPAKNVCWKRVKVEKMLKYSHKHHYFFFTCWKLKQYGHISLKLLHPLDLAAFSTHHKLEIEIHVSTLLLWKNVGTHRKVTIKKSYSKSTKYNAPRNAVEILGRRGKNHTTMGYSKVQPCTACTWICVQISRSPDLHPAPPSPLLWLLEGWGGDYSNCLTCLF